MDSLIEKFKKLPQYQKIILMMLLGGVIIYCLYSSFSENIQTLTQKEEKKSVLLNMPEPSIDSTTLKKNNVDNYKNGEYDKFNTDEYFKNLNKPFDMPVGSIEDIEKARNAQNKNMGTSNMSSSSMYLDPNIYSADDIYNIRNGILTKEEVDARRREDSLNIVRNQQVFDKLKKDQEKQERFLDPDYQDSIANARMEKQFQLMKKYQSELNTNSNKQETEEQKTLNRIKDEYQYRKINLKREVYIPSNSFVDDDIVSSLDKTNHFEDGGGLAIPAKVTFLRSERVIAGTRVILRLIEPLYLSNGSVIPANTHILGFCNPSNRLRIEIKTVQVGKKLYRVKLDAFDIDGMEGIYCPFVIKSKKKKVIKSALNTLGGVTTSALTAVFTANPYMGVMANQLGGTIQGELNEEDGTTSVYIKAGYEFYIYEDIKKTDKESEEHFAKLKEEYNQ